ncbi:ATP-binding protein, partial [Collinsella sp. HCP28S3_G2]
MGRESLLRRCALPAPKTFDGYDWSAVSWPEGMGRESLLALDFVERREDLVLMGDVGTGKTHMASALCALVFFTTTKFRISRLISFGFHRFAKVPHPFFANCPIFPS